jgi:hypothetical protein
MLSMRLMTDDWRSDTGGVFLRLLLIAGVAAPLAAAALGRGVATPFGLRLAVLAGVGALSGIAYAAWRARAGQRGLGRLAVDIVAVVILATVFALIIDRTSNGFYTDQVLADAMAVLLMVHLAGAALREVGLNRQRWPRLMVVSGDGASAVPKRSEPASMQFADGLTSVMTVFVACFWGLAVVGPREPAGILLLLAGAFGVVALLARLPSAFINERVLFREWRRSRRSSRDACTPGHKRGRHVGAP